MKYRIYPGTLEIIMEAQDGITDLNMLFDRLCLSRKDRYLYLQEGRITLNRIPARQADTALAVSPDPETPGQNPGFGTVRSDLQR